MEKPAVGTSFTQDGNVVVVFRLDASHGVELEKAFGLLFS
jgi:hypothetical protein